MDRDAEEERNIISLLADRGLDLYQVVEKKWWNEVKEILNHKDLKSKVYFQLLSCIISSDIEGARPLMETIRDIDFNHLEAPTPLRFAAIRRHLPFVEMLLDRGADPNVREFYGTRSILADILPEFGGSPTNEVIQLLLQRGARVNDVRVWFNSPALVVAATMNSVELLKLLISHGLDLSGADDAMYYVLTERNYEFAELLLQHGMDPNMRNYQGVTWLVKAIWANSLQMTEIFLKFGADVNLVQLTENKEFPLHFACIASNVDMVNLILKYNVDLRVETSEGNNVLQYAAKNVHDQPLKTLLKMNFFDVNHQNKKGETALHGVSVSGRRGPNEVISCWNAELLLKFGAKIDVEDKRGVCPSLVHDCENFVVCPLVIYYEKLKLLNYRVNDELLTKVFGGREFVYPENRPIPQSYYQELEEMKNIFVCYNPKLSLFDVMFMKRWDLIRFAENVVIMDLFQKNGWDFEKNYRSFGFILNRVVEQLNKKKRLLIPARDKFCDLVGTFVPIDTVNRISFHLSNSELDNFCKIEVT